MSEQNAKMSYQILVLSEKLEFFIKHIQNEKGKIHKGDYFKQKENDLKEKDDELGVIFRKMKKAKNQLGVMRRQLRLSYGIDKITELENEK